MTKPKKSPPPVSHKPLFAWFDADKQNRRKLVNAGYSDGTISNWKKRHGIPRGEIDAVARVMGLHRDQYLVAAGEEVKPIGADGLSEDAIEIARAFNNMSPQTQETVRHYVFVMAAMDKSHPWLRVGRPVSHRYADFEQWHKDNLQTQVNLEASRIDRGKP